MGKRKSVPFRNFEDNIARAQALARFDGYLQDLLQNAGKKTLGPLMTLQTEMMKATGMDEVMKDAMREFQTSVQKRLEEQLTQIDPAEIQKRAEELIKPHVKKLGRIISDLGLVLDQTLPEQALVLAVSAFEVYVRDTAIAVISSNPAARRRFTSESRGG